MDGRVWVVTIEQHYANHFRVIAVFDNKEDAEILAALNDEYHVEEYTLNVGHKEGR